MYIDLYKKKPYIKVKKFYTKKAYTMKNVFRCEGFKVKKFYKKRLIH